MERTVKEQLRELYSILDGLDNIKKDKYYKYYFDDGEGNKRTMYEDGFNHVKSFITILIEQNLPELFDTMGFDMDIEPIIEDNGVDSPVEDFDIDALFS